MVGQINGIVHRDSHISSALGGDQASRGTSKSIEVKEFAVVGLSKGKHVLRRLLAASYLFLLSLTTPASRGRSRTSTSSPPFTFIDFCQPPSPSSRPFKKQLTSRHLGTTPSSTLHTTPA